MSMCSRCGSPTQKLIRAPCKHYFCINCIKIAKEKGEALCSFESCSSQEKYCEMDETESYSFEVIATPEECNEATPILDYVNITVPTNTNPAQLVMKSDSTLSRNNEPTNIETDDMKSVVGCNTNHNEKCSYCDSVIEEEHFKDHYKKCLMYPIDCPDCCEELLQRDIEKHTNVCLRNLRTCKFSKLGCDFKGCPLDVGKHENDLSKHLEFFVNRHDEFVKQLEETRNELNERRGQERTQNETIAFLTSRVEGLSGEADRQKRKQESTEHRLKSEADKSFKLRLFLLSAIVVAVLFWCEQKKSILNQVTEEMRQLEYKLQRAETKIYELMTKNKVQYVTMQEALKSDLLEQFAVQQSSTSMSTTHNSLEEPHVSNYIWKIEGFTKAFNNAKSGKTVSIVGEPFYSIAFGYKMRLKLFPNGVGTAKGTHLSCYLEVMKGTWDNVLNWPLKKYVIKFSLLNQLPTKSHYVGSKLISVATTYEKHLTAGDFIGEEQFFPIKRLEPSHLVNDAIFIMVNVNIPN